MTDKFLFPSSQHSSFPHLSAALLLLHPWAPLEGWSINISLPLVEWLAAPILTLWEKVQWQIHGEKHPRSVTESKQGIQSLLINSGSSATDQIHQCIPPWTQRGEKSAWSRERERVRNSQEFLSTMSCNLETPKSWGVAKPVGRHSVMASQSLGSQGNYRGNTTGRTIPIHSTVGAAAGTSQQQEEGGSTAKAPGRE